MKQVIIVGAGVSGLATAYHINRLARERGVGVRVTVLEGSPRPGGRVWTERVDGFQVEVGANGFLDSKRSTLELGRALGLESELIAARPEARDRYILWRGRLHKVPMGPADLVRSGLLSIRGKLRLLAEMFVPRRRVGGDESVHEFACRRVGREAAEVLVDAMVTGIHAGDATLLSVAAAFPRMVELEREHGSLIRAMPKVRRQRLADAAAAADKARLGAQYSVLSTQYSTGTAQQSQQSASPGGTLWSFKRGMGEVIERLTESCGAEIIRGVPVQRIAADPARWIVHGDGRNWSADAIVLACPSFAQAAIVESLDSDLTRQLAAIRYTQVVVVAVGFRRADLAHPLDGFGYLSPQRTRRDVLGVLWSSSIFDHRAPAGMVLVQAMCGGWNRPEIVGWDDERIRRAVLEELRETMGVTAAPVLVRIFRWPQAIPQYHVGHLDRVARIEASRKQFLGLFLTGNSFRGVSVNDCTEEAVRCASEVIEQLTTSML
jgi:oxygen-dependent protoporphyrinogen oxidase